MVRLVTHRWSAAEGLSPGNGMPDVGQIIAGPRDHWRVVEVLPVESAKHPNAWKARLVPLGPHHHPNPAATSWWVYDRAAA